MESTYRIPFSRQHPNSIKVRDAYPTMLHQRGKAQSVGRQ